MRVLHLVPSLAGGGAEQQLGRLAGQLQKLGADVHIGFIHSGVNAELVLASKATLHAIPSLGNYNPVILPYIVALIRRTRPQIVQTWLHQMDLLGGLAAHLCNIPHVLSERSSSLAYPDTWKNRCRVRVGRKAVAIVANSQGGVGYWTSRVKQRASLHLIRNGLPLEDMQEIAPMRLGDWGLPSDAELVLFAGRLSPEKNLFVLLEALDLVLDRHPKAVAVLFGEGPLLPEIAKRIQSSRFSGRYRLRGYTQELWRWIRSAKVVVSISRFEGNPNVVLETMAIGCPLVVSDIPEHKEILRESMAMFCREGSAGDAAVAIGETLSHRDLAKERMERARDRAQIWSVGESASRYLRLYQALVAQGRR